MNRPEVQSEQHIHDVVIVGAGLAGLCATQKLLQAGRDVVLLEADSRPGGKLKTDRSDGFLLDHGFQVYLTSYQTAGQTLNLKPLHLKSFLPGAMVRYNNKWYPLKDPLRSPLSKMPADAWNAIASPIASWKDLWVLFRYRQRLMRATPDEILARPAINTLDRLRQVGFSERIIDRFFRPFLGGIFLDQNLEIDSSRMEFVFREMGLGTAALPEDGIQAIPESICKNWKKGILQLNSTASEWIAAPSQVSGNIQLAGSIQLSDGNRILGRKIIIATEASGAKRLLGNQLPISDKLSWNSTTCIYFALDERTAPTKEPILFLNGSTGQSDQGFSINHVAFPSLVQRSYAPQGQVLASVNINGLVNLTPDELLRRVRGELQHWFGTSTANWKHLRTYTVPCAFSCPSQPMPPSETRGLYKIDSNTYACGDYSTTASIEGAIQSGLLAAEAVLG